ncbi:MAG: hypothetical protein ACTSYX_05560 [Candidatus Thorarchaeota archaeon]
MMKYFSPLMLVDSIGDGAVSLLSVGSKILRRESDVVSSYASKLDRYASDIKARTPEDPTVIVDSAIKTASATAKAFVDTFGALVGGVTESAREIRNQINRAIM